MTAIDPNAPLEPQTPAQWAARWFCVAAAALLCGSVPLVHLVWHGALGHDAPPIRTRSQRDAPAPTVASVLDGDWMPQKQRELQEASPVTWSLRGHWNELRYRLGIPASERVHFGRDEWFFLEKTIRPDARAYEQATPARRAFLGEVRDLVRGAGAELLVVVVPDKARVYPDKAFADGSMPRARGDHYARVLAELAELGIATVDLATPLRTARRAVTTDEPSAQLYFARDTHWRPAGALIAGQVVAAAIEARVGARLGPRRVARLTGPGSSRAVGDLTANLGILSLVQPDPATGERPVAMSLLSDRLAEVREYYGLEFVVDGVGAAMDGRDPDADVLLLGTSYAEANGLAALSLALGRPVRARIDRGAQGILPLRAVVDELRAGTKAKVVVWEIVERGMFDDAWLDPRL